MAPRYFEKDRTHEDRADGDDQAESREFADMAVIPQLPDFHRYDLRARRIKQKGNGKLPERNEKNIDPTGEQRRHDERHDYLAHHLKPARAADHRPFFQFLVHTQQGGMAEANTIG